MALYKLCFRRHLGIPHSLVCFLHLLLVLYLQRPTAKTWQTLPLQKYYIFLENCDALIRFNYQADGDMLNVAKSQSLLGGNNTMHDGTPNSSFNDISEGDEKDL